MLCFNNEGDGQVNSRVCYGEYCSHAQPRIIYCHIRQKSVRFVFLKNKYIRTYMHINICMHRHIHTSVRSCTHTSTNTCTLIFLNYLFLSEKICYFWIFCNGVNDCLQCHLLVDETHIYFYIHLSISSFQVQAKQIMLVLPQWIHFHLFSQVLNHRIVFLVLHDSPL